MSPKKNVTQNKDECILHNGFKSHQDWDLAINESQKNWPEYVGKTYNCELYPYGRDDQRYKILLQFLEAGAYMGTIVYRRYYGGFSWVVVDHFAYALLLKDLEVDTDYVLVEQRHGYFNLVRRET
jgi:hypothetical protein